MGEIKLLKKILTLCLSVVGSSSLMSVDALAQNYPFKPIRIIVGFSAGSGADISARLISQQMSKSIGQQVIVDNRPGGAGSIAAVFVARASNDGYTLLLLTASDTILLALRTNLPYDLKKDFSAVSMIASGMYVLVVHPSLPVKNVKDLISLARTGPGKLSYGSSGVGSSSHLAGELFNSMAKVEIVQVPYKSATAGAVATAIGEIAMNYPSVPGALSLLAANKVRALAVTGLKRTMLMPSIPTLSEAGLTGYDRTTWHALAAPAGTLQNLITRLNSEIKKIVDLVEVKDLFLKQGIEAQSSAPDELAAHMNREIEENSKLVKLINVKPQQ